MKFDVMTLFPDMIKNCLGESITGRAIKNEIISLGIHNIRDYADNKHNNVDDTPYGGGMGMVMQCQPIDKCFEEIRKSSDSKPYVIYMSPKGTVLNQKKSANFQNKNILSFYADIMRE